ncbi:cobyrinic acid a,c-diamide synthase [Falsiroseomonas bella]|uniref:Cobyrinic acid a,c-diamide synthase n=1 Tax=Falsiroseomonas bella TaxID=2184016 RepID=A0A317FBF1_9PROT|nr:ParA family partition ATPase [Falsiroseomonas bella]PWS35812.1 cobyrinic acid a,c-diamide synthase [Falsiroseomonas bella]
MAFVVAVAQRKGGAGKSTLAANLAAAFAGLGERVALLDTDPQKTLSHWHQARGQAGGRATVLDFEAPAGWRVPAACDKLRRSHDVILLDTPPHDDTDARIAIRSADLVLVPLQPSPADLWATGATLDLAKAEKRPVAVALNRVPAQGRLTAEVAAALRGKGVTLLDATLGNRTGFAQAFAAGLGVTEAAPRSLAADEVRALAAALRGFRRR